MADDTHREDAPVELLAPPPGARMLTTLAMAKKTPGRCACGEHSDDAQESQPTGRHAPDVERST